MRVRLEFGVPTRKKREVHYHGNHPSMFPKFVRYDGNYWEFLSYQTDPSGVVEWVIMLAESDFDATKDTMVVLDMDSPYFTNDISYGAKCECGAAYERGFENAHSSWCQRWEKR